MVTLRPLAHRLGQTLIRWGTPPPADPVEVAIHEAYLYVGLPDDAYTPSTNLVPTGKLYAILHHAALTLGIDHQLSTVDDLIAWLRAAPRR